MKLKSIGDNLAKVENYFLWDFEKCWFRKLSWNIFSKFCKGVWLGFLVIVYKELWLGVLAGLPFLLSGDSCWTESSFKLLHRCITIDARTILWTLLKYLLQITYLNYFLKLILYSLLRIYTWVIFLESWYREAATRVVWRLLYLKFIPKLY